MIERRSFINAILTVELLVDKLEMPHATRFRAFLAEKALRMVLLICAKESQSE